MDLHRVSEHFDLPPCFQCWCDDDDDQRYSTACKDCGWKGRRVAGTAYVVGSNCPIEYVSSDDWRVICPRCKREPHRLIDMTSLAARFGWLLEHLGSIGGRGDDHLFPCKCSTTPPCRLEGEIEVQPTIIGDTCFCSDNGWIRIVGKAKCNGCYATGLVALVEHHRDRDLDQAFEAYGNWQKGKYGQYRMLPRA